MDATPEFLSNDSSGSDSEDDKALHYSCPLCLKFFNRSPGSPKYQRAIQRTFHEDCSRCLSATLSETRLCEFCKHLRIRHQSICHRPKVPLYIPLDPIELLETRKNSCPFCGLLTNAVREFAKLNGSTASVIAEITFKQLGEVPILEWNQFSGPSGQSAYCDVSCGDGYSNGKIQLSIQDSAAAHQAPLGSIITDWTNIRKCFENCLHQHSECNGRPDTLPKGFRVIDVKHRRIIPTPEKCNYVALSYVWGVNPQPSMLLALKSTIGTYQEKGGLDARRMPRTIEDAMVACTRLGIDYLWTDRLCIIQDDPQDKVQQIVAMSGIYTLASLVIISVDGNDMDAGLSGISRPRPTQILEAIEGLRVSPVLHTYHSMEDLSIWFTRGWTYQEAILANRKLYFTSSQVCYECEHQLWHEDPLSFGRGNLNKMSPQYQTPVFTMGLYGGRGTRIAEYARHLSPYRKRALTNQSDVYNAFTGILNALYGADEVLFGLPLPDFDQALLWRSYGIQDKLDFKKPYINSIDGMTLPSWSWGSMVGTPGLSTSTFTFQGTLVTWHTYSEVNGELSERKIEAVEAPLSWRDAQTGHEEEDLMSPRLYMALAWMEGCLETPLPDVTPSWRKTAFLDLVQALNARWKTYTDFWYDICKSQQTAGSNHGSQLLPGRLFGRVQTAFLKVGMLQKDSSRGLCILADDDEEIIGMAHMQDPLVELEILPRLEKDNIAVFEFLATAVSTEQYDELWLDWLSDDESTEEDEPSTSRKELTYYDHDGNSPAHVPTLDVMLIGRRGKFAHRICVGWVYLRKWACAGAKFQDVILE